MNILDEHLSIPKSRQLIVYLARFLILDRPSDCVVGAGKVSFRLELDIGD